MMHDFLKTSLKSFEYFSNSNPDFGLVPTPGAPMAGAEGLNWRPMGLRVG
jgi:hypothetical protein